MITIIKKGKRLGINRDGRPIGLATFNGTGWVCVGVTDAPPFDQWLGFVSTEDAAVALIASAR